MIRNLIWFFGHASIAIALAVAGCAQQARQTAAPEPTVIPISQPVSREVTDFVEFTGRVNAVQTVNVIPRVTGYLVQMPFEEGAEVKTGDLLFEIDPRPYKAQLDQALGQVEVYKAQLQLAEVTLARDMSLQNNRGVITQQQIDQDKAAVDEARARVKAYEASTEIYRLNVDFTQVHSPIDGMIGRHFMTVGNLVNQDQTLLATVVSLDPIYVYFEVDEPTLLRVRQAINEGRIPRPRHGTVPLYAGLQTEEGFPHEGTIDFVNNQINPGTGSIIVRAVFPNPKPENGVRLLTPGMFVRVRLPIGPAHQAELVIDRAIGSDQGIKYVYVVDDKNQVQSRRVQTGALQDDGLRVISGGLKPDEWVVVGALQQVRPHLTVQTEKVPMPSLGVPHEAEKSETATAEAPPASQTSETKSAPPADTTKVRKNDGGKAEPKQAPPHHSELR
ncbi:MAG TPA: efflux RND transporter periplasmic adaptor subunit [Pirellulaceae bacterium]